jgi:phosphatidylserine decarboxylase
MWFSISRHGRPFILAFAVGTLVLAAVSDGLGLVGLVLTIWCVAFFRDPARVVPNRAGLAVSPADGLIQTVDVAVPPAELQMDATPRPRVCIFMNVFDVHVNRTPIAGVIERIAYRSGKFVNASLDKASDLNERQSLRIRMADGRDLVCVQIAGLIARRIVTDVHEGEALATGQRIGMIRFGSRVDIYLPVGSQPLVCSGQRAIAGETVIADFASDEPKRGGITR